MQNIGYVGVIIWETLAAIVIIWETLAAIVIIWAVVRMVKAFGTNRWRPAKRLASVGLLMILFLFGFGFITVGGEYFSMWQSSDWNGLDAAIRNFTLAAVPLILLQLPAKEWDQD